MDDPKIKSLVTDQMSQWSVMMEKHRKEEWEMLKDHLKSQEDILKKLMEEEQQAQIKKMEVRHEQYVCLFVFVCVFFGGVRVFFIRCFFFILFYFFSLFGVENYVCVCVCVCL